LNFSPSPRSTGRGEFRPAPPVGRLKWLGEHTPSAGFDNFAWLRFDPRYTGEPPRLHPLVAHRASLQASANRVSKSA
jgi:hypothetical protein